MHSKFFWRSMATGVLARAALIACIYERGANLTGTARVKLSNSTLVTHISTDVSRVDACAQWFVSCHREYTLVQSTNCFLFLATSMQVSSTRNSDVTRPDGLLSLSLDCAYPGHSLFNHSSD